MKTVTIHARSATDYITSQTVTRFTFAPFEHGAHVYHEPYDGDPVGIDASWTDSCPAATIDVPDDATVEESKAGDLRLYVGRDSYSAADVMDGAIDGLREIA